MVKGTKYKKVQARYSSRRYPRVVHLVFWYHDEQWQRKYWKFVCGKVQHASLEFDLEADEVHDGAQITCRGCAKQAPDVVEKMTPNMGYTPIADKDIVELDYD